MKFIKIEVNELEIEKLKKENISFTLSPFCIKMLNELSQKLDISRSSIIENLVLKELGLINTSYFFIVTTQSKKIPS